MQKGADSLRCGIAQDGVQHRLGELADHKLALVLVGAWQNPADLLQQVGDGFLQRVKKKDEGVKVEILRQGMLQSAHSYGRRTPQSCLWGGTYLES